MAALPPPAQVAGANLALFEAIFKQADANNRGIIGAVDAAKFLKKSGLSEKVLSQIWDLSDPTGKGYLDKNGFFVAVKLISLAQNGKEVGLASINMTLPAPNMGIGIPIAIADGPWMVPDVEKTKYDQIFEGLQPVNGLLSGDKVRPVLLNSKLPVDVLGRVWDLSDIDKDGYLDKDEFAVAMHLVYKALEKEPVPMTLPPTLIPPSKRGGAPAPVRQRLSSSGSSSLPGAVPVIPAQIAAAMATSGPGSTSTVTGAVGTYPAAGATWVITAAEKAQYDDMFVKADLDKDGFVNGVEIKDIFLQSGVPQNILAHIWNLCDTKYTGKLNSEQFALAMYLVNLKIQGVEPPATLTPEMVPPSMRGATSLDGITDHNTTGMQELEFIQKEIDELKREKMKLETEKAQKDADIKIRNGEVQALQKELDGISMTVNQLESQKGEAQKRLDELDDKKTKLERGLQEMQEKCEDETKTIARLNETAENAESTVKNQEEEVTKMREELNALRQTEVELEQAIDNEKGRLDALNRNISESKTQTDQTEANIKRLQDSEPKLNEKLNAYNALLSGDPDAKEPVETPTGNATGGFGTGDDPFKSKDPFSGTNGDPFQSEDPFNNASNDDPFKGHDPFQGESLGGGGGGGGGGDPFGDDPFDNAFNAAQTTPASKPTTLQPPVKHDPFGNGDDFFTKASSAKNDAFDPFGGGGISSMKSPLNPEDPFGTGNFSVSSNKGQSSLRPRSKSPAPPRPKSPSPARPKSPARPSLPPKQKKAPAPPRPAPPRPAKSPTPKSNDPFGGADPFGGSDAFGSSFASFSPSKFATAPAAPAAPPAPTEADELAWATKTSREEFDRQKRLQDQEKADLEYALALSRAESSA